MNTILRSFLLGIIGALAAYAARKVADKIIENFDNDLKSAWDKGL